MTKKLRKLADEHAVIFWILCVLVFVCGNKVVRVGVLENTPYTYDVAFFKLSLGLLAILKSVLTTSVLFGIVHLGNLVCGQVASTILQVIYATVLGLVFTAAYLRTKNLWSLLCLNFGRRNRRRFIASGVKMLTNNG